MKKPTIQNILRLNSTTAYLTANFKILYRIWFPWLDIALLAYIYLFLYGAHINPYRHYQLIKHGEVAIGTVSGESGLYQYSDSPRMRDFEYTFALPNGKMVKSSAHTFTLDKQNWTRPKYPVTAKIKYLPNQPEINWINSDLSPNLADFFYRRVVFGTLFTIILYGIAMMVIRLSIRDYRRKQFMKIIARGPQAIS